jgi:hypothetical protein
MAAFDSGQTYTAAIASHLYNIRIIKSFLRSEVHAPVYKSNPSLPVKYWGQACKGLYLD